MKVLSLFGAALLLSAMAAWAQDKGAMAPSTPPDTTTQPAQAQPQPYEPPSANSPQASSTAMVNGTVESLVEGKTLKVRTAEGKVKSFNLKDASVDPSIKVGSSVKVTQSRDATGKGIVTVEPGQTEPMPEKKPDQKSQKK